MVGDKRAVVVFAVFSLLALAFVSAVRYFAPPAFAPRIHVRWAEGVTAEQRMALERQFSLQAGEARESSTWAYELADPSRSNIRALIEHPSVADTHHINRGSATVASSASRGARLTTAGALSRWRDSAAAAWIARFSLTSLLVCAAWLATTGRSPGDVT